MEDKPTTLAKALERIEELEREKEALQKQVLYDDLTGLLRREYAERRLVELLGELGRKNEEHSMLFIDLDHFRKINEDCGHESANDILREVGKLIQQNIRANDIGARFGGEEFIVILPGMNTWKAARVAEKLRKLLEQMQVGAKVTASFGIAQAHIGESKEEWLERADGAMYQAKYAGRNCVRTAE